MTDGRYDSRRGAYDQGRNRNEAMDRSSRDERGFLDRARDEVSSWFGDDDGRRERDYRSEDSGRERSYDRYEQNPRYRDEGYRRPYTGRTGSNSSFDDDGHRGPSTQNFDRGQSQRETIRSSSPPQSQGRHDSDYSQWRSRQIEELDRDYDEFRRENQSRFDSEFSTWRGQRQAKRQMLGTVADHMEVVGSDGQPLGTVDTVKGDRIILTKKDSPDGRHHAISCSMIDRVEDNKVVLNRTSDEAQRDFGDSNRDRALFEREDQGQDGPHMLNRSFSGTY